MLAKKYNFPYETLQVLSTVHRDSKRTEKPCVCKEGFEYPVWNSEILIEHINPLRHRIKKELNEKDPRGRLEAKRRDQIIRKLTQEAFKDLKICLVVEDGYKEIFYYDQDGECCMDLTTLQRIQHGSSQHHQLHLFHCNDQEMDLAAICPEFWCGHWVRVKSSP